jgi:copper(I)-binding protein
LPLILGKIAAFANWCGDDAGSIGSGSMLARFSMIVVLALLAPAALAADIAIEQPWARATPGRAPTGAAYLTLVNQGRETDRLVGVASPAAARAELHGTSQGESGHAGHVMEMRPLADIELKPGQRVVLRPNALHVMLVSLKAPLKEGTSVRLTLRFARAGEIAVDVPVGKAGAMGPPR